jgi:putative salt-induced outer membrane protein YdiY
MKKIILIIIMLSSISIFAKSGDLSVSINAGVSSGSGFGLNYSLTDNIRLKVATIYVGISDSDFENIFALGGSVSIDFKKFKDDLSSIYFFLGTEQFLNMDNEFPFSVYSLGLGIKKFIDKNMFWELEFGYGIYVDNHTSYYDDYEEDDTMTMLTAGVSFGYQF